MLGAMDDCNSRLRPAVIVRYSEPAVKGSGTRRRMEKLLSDHLEESLRRDGLTGRIRILPGRIIIEGISDPTRAALSASMVFGVKSSSPAYHARFNTLDDIVRLGLCLYSEKVKGRVFRVRARRVGKHDFTSKDVERALGGALYDSGARGVDLSSPEYTVYVEVRGSEVFFYDTIIPGPGGLPVGSEEPVLVLYSGGFDSTVAAWYAARRGSITGLVFYDLGVEEAWDNAYKAAEILAAKWARGWKITLYRADFVPLRDIIRGAVKPEYRVLILRRFMLEHASALALGLGYEALVTGESVGQVASQTVRNLRLIGSMLPLPVLRPLAGMDKDEIMSKAFEIGVYDVVSRQVEPCRNAPKPVPRGSLRVYREMIHAIRQALQSQANPLEVRVEKIVLS